MQDYLKAGMSSIEQNIRCDLRKRGCSLFTNNVGIKVSAFFLG